MTCGIYYYWDKDKDKVVYIGQSVNIEKRHIQHLSPSSRNKQPFNSILQSHPNRYTLEVMLECDKAELNEQEILAIKLYKPDFNFTDGGQCFATQIPWNKGKNYPQASERMKKNNPTFNPDVVNKIVSTNKKNGFYQKRSQIMKEQNPMQGKFGKQHPNYNKISSSNITCVLHLSVKRAKRLKQGFYFCFTITDKGKTVYRKTSIDIFKLKKQVIKDGYNWDIQDEKKYNNIIFKIKNGEDII